MAIPVFQLLLSALSANDQQNQQQQAASEVAVADKAAGIQNKRMERMAAQNSYQPYGGTIDRQGMSLPGGAMEKQNQIFNSISAKYQNKTPVAAVGGQWNGVGAGGY